MHACTSPAVSLPTSQDAGLVCQPGTTIITEQPSTCMGNGPQLPASPNPAELSPVSMSDQHLSTQPAQSSITPTSPRPDQGISQQQIVEKDRQCHHPCEADLGNPHTPAGDGLSCAIPSTGPAADACRKRQQHLHSGQEHLARGELVDGSDYQREPIQTTKSTRQKPTPPAKAKLAEEQPLITSAPGKSRRPSAHCPDDTAAAACSASSEDGAAMANALGAISGLVDDLDLSLTEPRHAVLDICTDGHSSPDTGPLTSKPQQHKALQTEEPASQHLAAEMQTQASGIQAFKFRAKCPHGVIQQRSDQAHEGASTPLEAGAPTGTGLDKAGTHTSSGGATSSAVITHRSQSAATAACQQQPQSALCKASICDKARGYQATPKLKASRWSPAQYGAHATAVSGKPLPPSMLSRVHQRMQKQPLSRHRKLDQNASQKAAAKPVKPREPNSPSHGSNCKTAPRKVDQLTEARPGRAAKSRSDQSKHRASARPSNQHLQPSSPMCMNWPEVGMDATSAAMDPSHNLATQLQVPQAAPSPPSAMPDGNPAEECAQGLIAPAPSQAGSLPASQTQSTILPQKRMAERPPLMSKRKCTRLFSSVPPDLAAEEASKEFLSVPAVAAVAHNTPAASSISLQQHNTSPCLTSPVATAVAHSQVQASAIIHTTHKDMLAGPPWNAPWQANINSGLPQFSTGVAPLPEPDPTETASHHAGQQLEAPYLHSIPPAPPPLPPGSPTGIPHHEMHGLTDAAFQWHHHQPPKLPEPRYLEAVPAPELPSVRPAVIAPLPTDSPTKVARGLELDVPGGCSMPPAAVPYLLSIPPPRPPPGSPTAIPPDVRHQPGQLPEPPCLSFMPASDLPSIRPAVIYPLPMDSPTKTAPDLELEVPGCFMPPAPVPYTYSVHPPAPPPGSPTATPPDSTCGLTAAASQQPGQLPGPPCLVSITPDLCCAPPALAPPPPAGLSVPRFLTIPASALPHPSSSFPTVNPPLPMLLHPVPPCIPPAVIHHPPITYPAHLPPPPVPLSLSSCSPCPTLRAEPSWYIPQGQDNHALRAPAAASPPQRAGPIMHHQYRPNTAVYRGFPRRRFRR